MVKRKKQKSIELHHIKTGILLIGIFFVVLFMMLNPQVLTTGRAVVLFILGAAIGLFDIPAREQNAFLLAAMGIMLATAVPFQNIAYLNMGMYVKSFLMNFGLLLTPAVVVTSLKIILRLIRETGE